MAASGGAHSLTIHLREDRRHIQDDDLIRLVARSPVPVNLEIAVTDEMIAIACQARPAFACLVPEKRQEITTEGGLDVAGLELVEGVAGQPAVAGELADVVVDGAVDLVGEALLEQRSRHVDHLGDVVACLRHHVGGVEVEERLVVEPGGGVEVGDLPGGLALERGRLLHLVAGGQRIVLVVAHVPDVGDVLDVAHLVAEVLERPVQQVAEQVRPQVADVRVLVDGAAAGVDADLPGLERLEVLDPAGERVVQPDLRQGVRHGRGIVAEGRGGYTVYTPRCSAAV